MSSGLALHGGTPVRSDTLPYGRQSIDEEDILAAIETLRSDWLTTGPKVSQFERHFADLVGTREAVALSSGTAALHSGIYSLGIGPGDEVIVPAMTFAASANCVVYQGGTPVFADVDAETLLIDPQEVTDKITSRTRALIPVDYAGHPCDYDALQAITREYQLALLCDACHSLGARYKNQPTGTFGDLSVFSLHPVKHITTGEGGVVTTNSNSLAKRVRTFRNHGIRTDHSQRDSEGSWYYEMVDLGYNYRLTDLQCAIGLSQLTKLPNWLERRKAIADRYHILLASLPAVRPFNKSNDVTHGYHLYVVRLDLDRLITDRATIFKALRAEGIGVNVHYIPVHLHPFYRRRFGTGPGLCPRAEAAYEEILSLPLFPTMTDRDVDDVITAMHKVLEAFAL